MKAHSKEDPAVHRLRRHFRSLRTEPPLPIKELKAKLERMLGKVPWLPGQFIYVINYAANEVVFAQGFDAVLGYADKEVDLDLISASWHPEDAPVLARFTEQVTRMVFGLQPPLEPFEATMIVHYRVRKADGRYIKVMRHTSIFDIDDKGGPRSTFSLCTDISKVKTSDQVGWEFHGPGVHRLDLRGFDTIMPRLQYRPTPRELEIIRLLVQGRTSQQIATQLGLSLLTVKTHRRNLIERTGCANTAAVVRLALEQGWC